MKTTNIFLLIGTIAMAAACGGKGTSSGDVNFKLQLATPPTQLAESEAGLTTLAIGDSLSFTPTSFRLPIMKISLSASDGSNEQVIYRCAGATEAECLVDLGSQTALDAIASAAVSSGLEVGTYSKLSLQTCTDGKGGSDRTTAYVTGSAAFKGTTWRTDADATGGTDDSGAGAAEETEVGNWSCATKIVLLNPGVTITETGDLDLTVVVDNTYGASFGIQVSPGRGGCKAESSMGGDGVCAEYPALLPYVGTGTTTTKRFLLSHHISDSSMIVENKANAMIIAVTVDNVPIMAYGRILYTATSAEISNNTAPTDTTYGGPNYITETNVETFEVNDDDTITFMQGGSADTYAAHFESFTLAAHIGEVKTRDGTATWKYKAIPLL